MPCGAEHAAPTVIENMRYKPTVLVVLATLCLSTGLRAQSPAVADAAMQKNVATVRDLLKQGADVNAAQGDGMTALHWAATHGDLELSKMLIVAGANIRATTRINAYTPLFLAAREGNAAVVGALLDAGALSLLEVIVVGVQAYVFTLLTATFIGMAIHAHH
jgi:hypothetical protein